MFADVTRSDDPERVVPPVVTQGWPMPRRRSTRSVCRVRRAILTGVLSCCVAVSGCSDSEEPSAAPSPTPSRAVAASPSGCPAPATTELAWPAAVPADLPKPPGASSAEVESRTDGLTVVTFTTPISIREAVLFLIDAMPKAGYTLARGDAENTEADAPFVKGDLRGVMRMIAVEECRTDWLMAVARASAGGAPGGGTPLLPPRPNASPLPFG